jgi:phosphatidylethanolamine/phosphatidyl-N-methylethanolamine N-methyltransferase
MDAQSLAFADDVFDAAVAMYVAAVVPDPTRMLGELKRVVRSGGHVYIVNHFAAARGFAGLVDRLAVPLTRRLHLRSDFSLDWLIEHAGMKLDGIANANLAGYVKVVRFRKTSP